MGKKLRNRELSIQTDLSNHEEYSRPPMLDQITVSQIRKIARSSLSLKKGITKIRRNNFRTRFNNRQLSSIITPSMFQCTVCLELMVDPVLMTCGHAYCHRCLQSNAAYSQKCCLCRSEQKGQAHIPIKFAEKIIQNFLVPTDPELIRYLCRTTDSAEWLKRRKMSNFKLGLVIDFQDQRKTWRRGVIVNVLNNDLVQIKVNVKGIQTYQKVEKASRRIAPYTFFTRNRYLEDFLPVLPEHDPTQNSLAKLEYKVWQEDNVFDFPEEGRSELHQNQDGEWEEIEDQAIRIFNCEMNEIDSILNI